MLVYASSGLSGSQGAAPFAGCEQLFARYPLAAAPVSGCGSRSMTLMTRAGGKASFFILTDTGSALFYIRAWNCRKDAIQEVIPGGPVPGAFARAIADGMPVPRDGAVLGWVADRQVTAILAVHGGCPEGPVPQVQVMPMSGIPALDWPPFAASPLVDGRLWDYVDRGDVVDIAPLLASHPGHAFRAACPGSRPAGAGACVVVAGNLVAGEYWLPAGVYADHWALREGVPAPPAGDLLARPGTVDLALELRARHAAAGACEPRPAEDQG